MNVEETLKHLGNHWDLYSLAGDGEYSFDKAKKYLMDECGKPESTARAKMSAFRYARDSLIKISSDGKRYFIDLEKLNILEASMDSVIHFSKIDYRGQEMEELEVLYDFQKGKHQIGWITITNLKNLARNKRQEHIKKIRSFAKNLLRPLLVLVKKLWHLRMIAIRDFSSWNSEISWQKGCRF
ncbi:hypothetical protein SAMN02910400_01834 [Lachnospiraceae bacterium C10]|nr:hypothetical protein SAMN02910400_01834 [Lachnospiraceae bacterium C10]